MKVAVLDAQGAGLGKAVIKALKMEVGDEIEIVALGTNLKAGENMKKAGANRALSGEKDICDFCINEKPKYIIGPIGVISAGAIKGEITKMISQTVFNMDARKYIIPLQKHGIYIPGTRDLKIKDIIKEIVEDIKINIKGAEL